MSCGGKKVIVVTGSYKGIGFEIVRLLCEHYGDKASVFMTARDTSKAQESLQQLKAKGLNPILAQLDISSKESVTNFREMIESQHGGVIHSLINNAAIAYKRAATEPFGEQAKVSVDNNYFGLLLVCEQLLPLLASPGGACVINVASGCGYLDQVSSQWRPSFSETDNVDSITATLKQFVELAQTGEHEKAGFSNSAYGMSKLGMIAWGRVQAKLLASKDIAVINMCPGWCKSDMAGWERPPRTAAEGADTVFWLETLDHDKRMQASGKFFRDRKEIGWDKFTI